MVRHAVRTGASVAAYDSRPAQVSVLRERYADVTAFGGDFKSEFLDGVSEIAISPGLSPHASPLKEILTAANERDINVVGELDLFARAIAAIENYTPKVLAVTGTNGKTTVTALTQHLCTSVGVLAVVVGNISLLMLDVLCDALDNDTLPAVWVLELSSFQLQFAREFNPHAATVLNISQDHLDWHADMAEYVAAKARIFGAQTVQVLNRDDACGFARDDLQSVSFGVQKPVAAGEYGLWRDGAMDWLSVAGFVNEEEPRKKRGQAVVEKAIEVQRLMPADALKIRGRHNAMNALAALALCRAIDLPLAKLLHGLRTYAGEPHRVQHIAHINGVDFYDDSKGTNVGATLAAINGLGQPIVLIAGGEGKGQDFAPLFDAVKAHVKRMDLIGKDARTMQSALAATGVAIYLHDSLDAATQAAAQAAIAGDAVLLSPACASLDMFKNYAHRAQVFVDAVQAWSLEQGQI